MSKQSRTLILVAAAAAFSVAALAQEIVIEPTNGRAPTANHTSRQDISRPAAERPSVAAAPKSATKPATKSAIKIPANQVAAKREAASEKAKPSLAPAPVAMSEAAEPAPAPKKVLPPRPTWAMADTRDSESLQSEIVAALARDPKLAGSTIQVSVDDGSVTLEGHAAGGLERLQAERLAKSYAWNRKLIDHVEVQPSMAAKK
jgi:hypothetical protein